MGAETHVSVKRSVAVKILYIFLNDLQQFHHVKIKILSLNLYINIYLSPTLSINKSQRSCPIAALDSGDHRENVLRMCVNLHMKDNGWNIQMLQAPQVTRKHKSDKTLFFIWRFVNHILDMLFCFSFKTLPKMMEMKVQILSCYLWWINSLWSKTTKKYIYTTQ